jgi:hypothetical protein
MSAVIVARAELWHHGLMRDEIVAQHRRLDGLFEGVRNAFADAGLEAGEALGELGDALAAHFEQEDRLYYPTVGSLRPEHRSTVERLAGDHERFLIRLDGVAARVRHGGLEEAAEEFERFAGDFARHEDAEEALLRALQTELDAARGAP